MSTNENQFENWVMPDLGKAQNKIDHDDTLFGRPASWYNGEEEIEVEPVDEEPAPLTLEDIEAIRLSAYEDGFKEGKEAGFEKGLAEGTVEGLKEGFEKGTEQGIQEGLILGKGQIDEQVATWESLIDRLYNPLEKLDDSVEYQLMRLSTSLAEQIARTEVKTNPQIILQALKQAVEALPISEQTLKILLHPDDLLFVKEAYSEDVCDKRGWDFQPEPALERGDCQIQTKVSSIDYTFSSRVEQVLSHFFQENHDQTPEKNDTTNLDNDVPFEHKADSVTEPSLPEQPNQVESPENNQAG